MSRVFSLLVALGLLTACPKPEDTPDDDAALPPIEAGALDVTLRQAVSGSTRLSFVVPLPRGKVPELGYLRLQIDGQEQAFHAAEVLSWWDGEGNRESVRAVLVQVDRSTGDLARLSWGESGGTAPDDDVVDALEPAVSAPMDESIGLAERTIVEENGEARLVETSTSTQTIFSATVPRVWAQLDPEDLASAQAYGRVPPVAAWSALGLDALGPYGEGLVPYVRSAGFDTGYLLNVNGLQDPTNPLVWENGRCSTFAVGYALTGDDSLQLAAQKSCAWYAEQLDIWAADLGLWTLNDPLARLSFHGRELFALTVMTGSRRSAQLSSRVADLWLEDALISDYRAGRLQDDYWTEQQIAVALEGLWYGYEMSGKVEYLDAFDEIVGTMYTHALGTPEELQAMGVPFPPQNCLVHRASQVEEIDDPELPWCSPWMTAMLLDPLVQWRDRKGDARVDELLLAFGRFLRDTGSSYAMEEFTYCDAFLEPATCYEEPAEGAEPRILIPVYASGIDASGERRLSPIEGDFTHCADAAALTAAALEVVRRVPELDAGPVGPFANEGASFEALYQEFAACAAWNLEHYERPWRNPGYWSSEGLVDGLADPAAFIARWKIGYPDHVVEPLRQSSWWYGMGLEQVALLRDAGLEVSTLEPGQVQHPDCPVVEVSACP